MRSKGPPGFLLSQVRSERLEKVEKPRNGEVWRGNPPLFFNNVKRSVGRAAARSMCVSS